jgi:hypothetical protein
MKVVDTENPLDLSEKSGQEPEVSAGHPNEARYHFRHQLFVRKCDAGRQGLARCLSKLGLCMVRRLIASKIF